LTRRLRVLQLHTRYRQAGGEDAVVATEAELLRDAGHDVAQHLTHNPEGARASAAALMRAPWNSAAAAAAAAAIRERRPDVVHIHNTWFASSPAVVAAARASGAAVVMTLHNFRLMCGNGMLFRDGHPCERCVSASAWQSVPLRCYRSSAVQTAAAAATIELQRRRGTWQRDVDLFLALTQFGRSRFLAEGLPAARVRVHAHGVVDPGPRISPPSASREVLFVGRLSPEKGVDVLLEAWRRAAPVGLRLVVVGDGPERQRLADLRVPGVELAGRMTPDELIQRRAGARALAFPSVWYETFGLVVVEAMASGLPVLVSDLGGTSELLRDGSWSVPAGDVDAWAAALARLADGDAVDAAGAVNRDHYLQRFTRRHAGRSLEAAYGEAISRRA